MIDMRTLQLLTLNSHTVVNDWFGGGYAMGSARYLSFTP